MNENLIYGVEVNDLMVFQDERGMVMRMMRRDDPFFKEFGEVYFSIIKPNVVKAWHLHKSMTLNYACVYGMIKLVIYDAREDSPTFEKINEFILSGYGYYNLENYKLVTIPPMVWNGFRQLVIRPECPGKTRWKELIEPAIVANCATEPHDPDEIVRSSPDELMIPYDWGPYEVAG